MMKPVQEILPEARGTLRQLPATLIECACCFCLWFSLPLSVWLIDGWTGLVLHLQAELQAACGIDGLLLRQGSVSRVRG